MNKNFKKVMLFIGLTFFVNWSMVSLFFALGGKWGTIGATVMAAGFMFVPMVVAIIVQKLIYKEPLKDPLGISFKLNRWFLIAWLLPAVIAFASLGASLLLPSVEYSPSMEGLLERYKSIITAEQLQQMQNNPNVFYSHPILIGLLLGLIAGVTINAVAGFGDLCKGSLASWVFGNHRWLLALSGEYGTHQLFCRGTIIHSTLLSAYL
jgi:hypothetical protein